MAEQAKTPSQIESDAEAAKYPNATEVDITLTRGPKKEAPDFIPKSVSDSRRYTDDPSMFTAAPVTALGGGLADGPSQKASSALKIEDDIGLMDEPVGAMVFEDDIDLFDFQGEKHDKMEIVGPDNIPLIIQKTEPETDYAKALKYGLDKSTIMILLNKEVPDYREQVFSEEVVSALGEFFGDIPPILLGGAVGGVAGGPMAAVGGGFAMTSGFKKHLMDSIEKGKLNVDLTAPEFWERMVDVTEETAKGYATGVGTWWSGKTAGIAAELAQASKFTKAIAKYAAITEGMVLTQSTLEPFHLRSPHITEGHVPTGKDHAVAGAAAILMSKTAQVPGALAKAVKKSQEKWSNEGKHPLKIKLEEITDSPILEPVKGEEGAIRIRPDDIDAKNRAMNRNNPEWDDANDIWDKYDLRYEKRRQEQLKLFKRFWDKFRNLGYDRRGKLKGAVRDTFGDRSKEAVDRLELEAGWHEMASLDIESVLSEMSKGLSSLDYQKLGSIIESKRTIEIDKWKKIETQELWDELKELNQTKENYANLKLKNTEEGLTQNKKELSDLRGKKDEVYEDQLNQQKLLANVSVFAKGLKEITDKKNQPIKEKIEGLSKEKDRLSQEAVEKEPIGFGESITDKAGLSEKQLKRIAEIDSEIKKLEGKIKKSEREDSAKIDDKVKFIKHSIKKIEKGLSEIDKDIKKKENAIKQVYSETKKEIEKELKPIEKRIKETQDRKEKVVKVSHPWGKTGEQHQRALDSLSEATKARLYPKADVYFAAMARARKIMLDEGLIDQEAYDAISRKGAFYSPRIFVDPRRNSIEMFDPDDVVASSRSGQRVMTSGLKRLEEGSIEELFEDPNYLIETVFSRLWRRALRNRSAQSLYDLASDAERVGTEVFNDALKMAPENEVAPAGFTELTAMVNGKQKTFWMRDDIVNEYIDDPSVASDVGFWAQMLLMTRLLKISATGLNPEFLITNIPRDMALTALVSEQYSRSMTIGLTQLSKDMASVAKDLKQKGPLFQEAAKEGMWMNMYTAEALSVFKGRAKKVIDKYGYISNYAEQLPRLAHYKRARDNGLSPREAAAETRRILDFHQGGRLSKYFELISPYFNASVQGTRSVFRYAKDNPLKFAAKVTEMGIASSAFYWWNTYGSGLPPEVYNKISAEEKTKFFIFLLPWQGEQADDGSMRYPYFRIAKDPGQQYFTPVFDYVMSKILTRYDGKPRDFDKEQFIKSITGASPVTLQSYFNPMANAMISYFGNYHTYFRTNIYKGRAVEPWAEYDEETNPLSKKIGKKLNISPMRLEAAIASVFAQSNPVAPLMGMTFDKIFGDDPEMKEEKRKIFDEWSKKIFVRRATKWTKHYNPQELRLMDEYKKEENTIIVEHNKKLDRIYENNNLSLKEKMNKASEFANELGKKASKEGATSFMWKEWQRLFQSPTGKSRNEKLMDMGMLEEKIGKIPDRAFWHRLDSISDPAKQADFFYKKLQRISPEMKKRYEEIRVLLEIADSEATAWELNKLKTQNEDVKQ